MAADGETRDALRVKWARAISGAGGKSPTNAAAQLELFKGAAQEYGQAIGNGLLRNDAADDLWGIAEAHGLVDEFGVGEVHQAIVDGFHAAATTKTTKANGAAPPPRLTWLDMLPWDSAPVPERKWAIRDRVPLNQAGLFSGEGGTGKSIIELMKDVAHVVGKDWLGSMPEQGSAIYVGAEDEADELHRRLAAIASHYGVTFKELTDGGLHVLCLLGQDATLCAAGKSGRVEVTALYQQLYQAAGDIKPKNISIDTLSRAFAGNELDRGQVYAFAMHMQALAMAAGGAVTILSHPSLTGINTGTGISGSTAWHGAFRFRQYLKSAKAEPGEQPDDDIRELEFKKNQYGPSGATITLRYERGLFLPVAGPGNLEKLAREQKINDLFLLLLGRFNDQKRWVSHKKRANYYAPTAFADTAEAKAIKATKKEFEAAMERLFAANKISVMPYGPPSDHTEKLVPQ